MYLYEIIEDYKSAKMKEEKDKIFKSFCSDIWGCDNKRRIITRTIKYKVRKDLIGSELGKVFDLWSEIEYQTYNPVASKSEWYYVIRQKINNIYTRYSDKNVILNNEYMDLINTPKKLYYRWIGGEEMNAKIVTDLINDAISESIETHKKYQMQKIDILWTEYKKIIEGVLRIIIDRCDLTSEYEFKNKDKLTRLRYNEYNNEDCIYISYFCKNIEGEMMKWQKKYYGVRDHQKYKRCKICGKLIEITGNKRSYCNECAKGRRLERYKKYNQKRNHK